MNEQFDFRQDTSCGYHIHISPTTKSFSLDQLRRVAKAVVLFEPMTARCAPPSRQDNVMAFCKSNTGLDVLAGRQLWMNGLSRGLRGAEKCIDFSTRNAAIYYVCPDKYRAWNFLPAKDNGHGSIEFRRPPGVVNSKKAKHWIAFTMSFIDMAMRQRQDHVARICVAQDRQSEFEARILDSAKALGVYAQLDPRLRQLDRPRCLYTSAISQESLDILRAVDPEYGLYPDT
ncbi:hypothetical protein BS50DRAFT_633861 [Corynespora cassiicola Philippines]|uniref:Amidoligase enzyme n=1 Tax=Corynespora cassiicola Philippines TaxID=1448308 RepID=A0A2T2NSA1_CORCC|nr:hypothetical protein BS50DRAFT_633861 [Corynespora cassiicola Philippines]